MKHATSRMLFAYWDEARGERAAPDRADLEPARMRPVLADTFVLQIDEPDGAAFRLAGTRCCALFGRELRAAPFASTWAAEERAEAERLVRTVAVDTIGLVVGLQGTSAEGAELPLEMVLLPLRHRGRTEARLLGALSPAFVPSWAGLVPLRSLSTRSIRVIQASPARLGPAGQPLPAERRKLFVVHQGGRN